MSAFGDMVNLVHIYALDARPDVEACGYWEVDGRPVVNVQWRSAPNETRLDTILADRVRSEPEETYQSASPAASS
jgi:hypothetical protein